MKRRAFCILISFLYLFPTQIFAAYIATDIIDFTDEKGLVEAIAIDYITEYVYNAYLYQSNNLMEGTVNEVFAMNSGNLAASTTAANTEYYIAGEYVSAATLCNRIASFKAAADYFKYIRTEQNIQRYQFSYFPTIVETVINPDNAYVHIYTQISFKYQQDGETALCRDNYIVYLLKINGEWCIADVDSEELAAFGLTDLNETYNERIAEFNARNLSTVSSPSSTLTAQTASTTAYDRVYNANNAVAYAYTYTTSSYNDVPGTGNDSNFINANFNNYTGMGGNCQNFASQCVWAGFGGIDTTAAVNSHAFPMNDYWYDTKSNWVHTASWTGTDDFYEYVTSDVSEINAICGTVDNTFPYIALSSLPGAVLHVNPNESGYAHAVVITAARSHNAFEIEICGNSPMRKAVLLSDQYYDDTMRLMIPTSMKSGRTCTGSSHSFSGNHCKCSYCGYNKLVVSGTMLKPIAAGTTRTITATANSECYRMAICISYGGQETWTEYTNTDQITKTFTFSNTGLYTITVVARDVNPSDSNSVTATHTFNIRVY